MKKSRVLKVSALCVTAWLAAGCGCKCPPCPEVECPPCAGEGGSVPYSSLDWTVERVIDGDTVVVAAEGAPEPEKVRLLQINTPERNRRGYGEATNALSDLVRGEAVRLEFVRPGVAKRDRYGRLLAYLFVDEMNVNVEMVRLGWSKFWTKYGRGRFPEAFEQAEAEARAHRRGLFSK